MTPKTADPPVQKRMSADERRESILVAALDAFAHTGYHGTSTETIAEAAGISQPYLFRLFGTKRGLFIAASRRCFRRTLDTFQAAVAAAPEGEEGKAMGAAYVDLLNDRTMLLAQMQTYAACDDPEICAAVREGYGELYSYVEAATGAPADEVWMFFAKGMFMNVLAAMDLGDSTEPWAQRAMDGLAHADEQDCVQ